MSNEAIHNDSTPSFNCRAAITTLYRAVKQYSTRNMVEICSAATDKTIGIAQITTEAAGEGISVKRNGFSYAVVGAAGWTKGAKLTPDASGGLVATTTAGHLVCAIAMEAANATEFGEVLLLPYPMPYSSF